MGISARQAHNEIPAWEIDLLLDGLRAELATGDDTGRPQVDEELAADPDPFDQPPPYMRT